MESYQYTVVLLKFLVDFLLLVSANRLCGYPPGWIRAAIAAAVGALYTASCLLPELYFLGNIIWRIVTLLLMSWAAYGANKSGLRRGVIFLLLSMALTGASLMIGRRSSWSMLAAAGMLFLLCAIGFRNRIGHMGYVPVELYYGDRHLTLTALHDTGNMLFDPVSGKPVLIVCAKTAQKLTGLTEKQLKDPVSVMEKPPLPGLRLVPYRSIGQSGGLLLALRLQQVKIGSWSGSSLVAFAPDKLCADGAYQALTGGTA